MTNVTCANWEDCYHNVTGFVDCNAEGWCECKYMGGAECNEWNAFAACRVVYDLLLVCIAMYWLASGVLRPLMRLLILRKLDFTAGTLSVVFAGFSLNLQLFRGLNFFLQSTYDTSNQFSLDTMNIKRLSTSTGALCACIAALSMSVAWMEATEKIYVVNKKVVHPYRRPVQGAMLFHCAMITLYELVFRHTIFYYVINFIMVILIYKCFCHAYRQAKEVLSDRTMADKGIDKVVRNMDTMFYRVRLAVTVTGCGIIAIFLSQSLRLYKLYYFFNHWVSFGIIIGMSAITNFANHRFTRIIRSCGPRVATQPTPTQDTVGVTCTSRIPNTNATVTKATLNSS